MPKCVLYILSPRANEPDAGLTDVIQQANQLQLPLAVVKILPTTQPESPEELFAELSKAESHLAAYGISYLVMVADEATARISLSRLDPLSIDQVSSKPYGELSAVHAPWTATIMSVSDVSSYAKEVWSGQRINCL